MIHYSTAHLPFTGSDTHYVFINYSLICINYSLICMSASERLSCYLFYFYLFILYLYPFCTCM